MAGETVRFAKSGRWRPGSVLFLPSLSTPCLLRQFGDSYRMLLRDMETPGLEFWDPVSSQLAKLIGIRGLLRLYEGLLAIDIVLTLASRLRPYANECGAVDRIRAEGLLRISETIARREHTAAALAYVSEKLLSAPRKGEPSTRPVVGVTGDLYTRINPAGNAGLFQRLEELGCEVWPSPFLAGNSDLISTLEFGRNLRRGDLGRAAREAATRGLISASRRKLLRDLSADTIAMAVEPSPEVLMESARPFVGMHTNYMILSAVAKMADFLRRGASGVINAAGINCMVGAAASAAIPAIRASFGDAPAVTLFYGNSEGPAQRVRLETFVHQVHQFHGTQRSRKNSANAGI
jgi:hypothetical protein